MLIGFLSIAVLFSIWQIDTIKKQFFDVEEIYEGERDPMLAGAGRFLIWKNNFIVISKLSFERKLTGIGLGGNTDRMLQNKKLSNLRIELITLGNSHNDFISALLETGFIGFLIVIVLYYSMVRSSLRLKPDIRIYFLSFLISVVIMHLLSNSYMNRFGLWQSFFIIISGMDVFSRTSQKNASGLLLGGKGRL